MNMVFEKTTLQLCEEKRYSTIRRIFDSLLTTNTTIIYTHIYPYIYIYIYIYIYVHKYIYIHR